MVDYIALKKPVIAMVPEVSEARRELEKSGLGLFLTGQHNMDMQLLENFISGNKILAASDYSQRYLASSQVQCFSDILNTTKDYSK